MVKIFHTHMFIHDTHTICMYNRNLVSRLKDTQYVH